MSQGWLLRMYFWMGSSMAMCRRVSKDRIERACACARAKMASLPRMRVAVRARASWYILSTLFA